MRTPDKDKASGQTSLRIDKDSIYNLSNCGDMLPGNGCDVTLFHSHP